MHSWSLRSVWKLAIVLTALVPWAASAQLAPVGAERFDRGPDLGSGGSYPTSVPLDLPAARGGLPVPVSLQHGGTRMGAAGRGWDVPLSVIREDASFAHRRPALDQNHVATPRQHVSLSLLGQSMELIVKDGVWVPQTSPATITAKFDISNGGSWKVYDGNGLIYTFSQQALSANQQTGLWLLKRIDGPNQAKVELEYDVHDALVRQATATQPIPDFSGKSIDLIGVKYNFDASGPPAIAKHEVTLEYDTEQPTAPLAMSVQGNQILVRSHKLMSIVLKVRATPAVANAQELTRYRLNYGVDPDTSLPLLQSVTMDPQPGSAEASGDQPQKLLLGRYEYGTATTPKRDDTGGLQLAYVQTQPWAAPTTGPMVSSVQVATTTTTKSYVTPGMPVDVTGDGRLDFVHQTQTGLAVARNRPGPFGEPVLTDANLSGTLNDSVMQMNHLGSYKTSTLPPVFKDYETESLTDTFREFTDANGDGRPDLIVADEVASKWVVYLNQPGATDPQNTQWVRREYSVADLILKLEAKGHQMPVTGSKKYLPLRRERSGQTFDVELCAVWNVALQKWVQTNWNPNSQQPGGTSCGPNPLPRVTNWWGEQTATEWELMDFNGDGGLDLVMAGSPISTIKPLTESADNPPAFPGPTTLPTYRQTPYSYPFRAVGDSDVWVVYNVSAASPVPQSEPKSVGGLSAQGGVARWARSASYNCSGDHPQNQCAPAVGDMYQLNSLRDINGDGLVDHLFSGSARLGTGAGFTGYLKLSAAPLRYVNQREVQCMTSTTYSAAASLDYRDVTGDGIPDAVYGGNVQIGTGAGFAAPIPIDAPTDFLPVTSSACNGSTSDTSIARDYNGDGRLDAFKSTNGVTYLYQLNGSSGPRALSAGQLTAIENGHGARTEITYISAKDDNSTKHQVPYPEIVVGKVRTVKSGSPLTETTYAYGNPQFGFDALSDRFRSFGYGRTVSVTAADSAGRLGGGGGANATITDFYPIAGLPTFDFSSDEYFARYLRPGRVRDVTVLSGSVYEATHMLTTNVATDPRRIGGTHYDYGNRVFFNNSSEALCADYFPYTDWTSPMNTCRTTGFLFTSETSSWRGTAAPPATQNVETRSKVMAVDDLGRVTQAYFANDTHRADDDVCVNTNFAASTTALPRILTAVSEERVFTGNAAVGQECQGSQLTYRRNSYDGLAPGQVSATAGNMTAQVIERRNAQTGAVLDTVIPFDALYDALGNPTTVRSDSGDGRTRTVTTTYDPFGLFATSATTTATGAAALQSTFTTDPLTLLSLSATEPNGTKLGTTYDGFWRPVLRTVTPAGGTLGVLSKTSYVGFDLGSSALASGSAGSTPVRKIIVKTFDNPVPLGSEDAAAGHTTTTQLDEFGRATSTLADLGADYGNELMVGGVVRFDELGRVAFAADPFPASQDPATAYGTTYYYNTDGTPKCAIRGRGEQAYTEVANESLERYPTCYRRYFASNQEYVGVKSADALLSGSPQAGIERLAASSAIGRVLRRWTQSAIGNVLEDSEFGYDRLGNVILQKRYKSRDDGISSSSTFAYDTLGRLLSLSETGTETRYNQYSKNWGEMLETYMPASTNPPTPERRKVMSYDGLGRLKHSEERNNGTLVPETVYDYTYDTGTSIHSAQPATNVLGRLTRATSPTSDVYFGYDVFGRIKAKATKDPQNAIYVQTNTFDADGALTELGMVLPDSGSAAEKMSYEYDSARRLRRAHHLDAANVDRQIYNVAPNNIDAFGRVRSAQIGFTNPVTYTANYADVGRRLLNQVNLAATNGDRRAIDSFSYDPVGRERQRRETKNTAVPLTNSFSYDPLGQLGQATSSAGGVRSFGYDVLGNVTKHDDSVDASDVTMAFRGDNPDRICRVDYGPVAVVAPQVFTTPRPGTGTIAVTGVSGNMPSNLKVNVEVLAHYGTLKFELKAPDGTKFLLEQGDYAGAVSRTYTVNASSKVANGTWSLLMTVISTATDTTPGTLQQAQLTILPPAPVCNVSYDAHGNVVQQATLGGGTRTLDYFASGQAKRIARQDGGQITFRYDAFGQLQEADTTGVSADARHDRHYGMVEKRDTASGTILVRNFPVGGMMASRRGPGTDWVFSVSEPRGGRYFVDGSTGTFAQDVDYDAYGKPSSTGVATNDKRYSREQWNDGDNLAAFGLSYLGARLYDPLLGRFMSPDPLMLMRTATTSNPYAFAENDPINKFDPSGLDPEDQGGGGQPLDWFPGFGSGGGGNSCTHGPCSQSDGSDYDPRRGRPNDFGDVASNPGPQPTKTQGFDVPRPDPNPLGFGDIILNDDVAIRIVRQYEREEFAKRVYIKSLLLLAKAHSMLGGGHGPIDGALHKLGQATPYLHMAEWGAHHVAEGAAHNVPRLLAEYEAWSATRAGIGDWSKIGRFEAELGTYRAIEHGGEKALGFLKPVAGIGVGLEVAFTVDDLATNGLTPGSGYRAARTGAGIYLMTVGPIGWAINGGMYMTEDIVQNGYPGAHRSLRRFLDAHPELAK